MGSRSWFARFLSERRDRGRAAVIAVTALTTILAVLIDKLAPHFAVSLQNPGLVGVAEVISVLGNPTVYCVPGAIAFFVFKLDLPNRDLARKALLIGLSPVVAGLVVNFGEIMVGRPRPMLPVIHWQPLTLDHDFWSFPSEHAAVAAAAAAALSLLQPEYRLTFFGMAVLVAGARFLLGVHYPTDLVVGFILGVLTFFVVKGLTDRCDALWWRYHPVATRNQDGDPDPPDLPL